MLTMLHFLAMLTANSWNIWRTNCANFASWVPATKSTRLGARLLISRCALAQEQAPACLHHLHVLPLCRL